MRIAFTLLCLALPVAAQPTPQFRYSAPIEVTSKEPTQRLELPLEVYREAKRDLSDVRVLNGKGEPVPIGFAGSPDAVRVPPTPVELPQFPITRLETTAAKSGGPGTEVTIRTQDGTLVAVRGRGVESKNTPKAVAYLLDASALKDEPIRALIVDWDAAPGSQVVNVRVEASEDLKSWTPVGGGPLVSVQGDGRALTQPRIDFAPRKARYLRLTWDAPGFVLKRARAEKEAGSEPAARVTRVVQGTAGAKPGEYLYDLGGRLPVEAYRLIPADVNDVVAATILARNDEKEPWRTVGFAPFYNLRQADGEKQSPPIEIGRLSARYWMARVGQGAAPRAPALEIRWRPGQLVFVARGDGPFTLAFGDAQAPAVALPVSAMLPNYKRLAELELPVAKVAEPTAAPPPGRWETWWRETNARRLTLWAILIGGVAVLGVMAWRLMGSG